MGRGRFPRRGQILGQPPPYYHPRPPGQESPVGPYDYGGDDDARVPFFTITFTFTNRIPVNAFAGRARQYALRCPIAYEFIVAYLAGMARRKDEIEKGVRRYIPEVTGRLKRSVYVDRFLLSGVPLMTSRVVYAGVEFGADSRRSRERARRRPAQHPGADDLAGAMLSYLRSPHFGTIVDKAAREAARHCTTPSGGSG